MKKTLLVWMMLMATTVLQARAGGENVTTAKNSGPHRPRLALVLGGGGAKGAAHAGALKVLEEAGLRPDFIVGTSIGSIVGGLYACGYRSADIQQMFQSQEWLSLLGDRRDSLRRKIVARDEEGTVYVLGFPFSRAHSKRKDTSAGIMRGDNIVSLLDSMIMHAPLPYDSVGVWKRFRCVAYDGKNHLEYVFDHGDLTTAMRASMAIPGVFKPVRVDTLRLHDGGLINNLPCDVAKAMGADVIIAIDLTQNHHEDEDADSRVSLKEKFGIGGLLNWAVERPDLRKYQQNRQCCDIYINPDLKGYGAGSFKPEAISDMMQRGETAARKQLKKLRRLAKELKRR